MDSLLLKHARQTLSTIAPNAHVLDVGTGNAPYRHIRTDLVWSGLDIELGPSVDYVILPGKRWPIEDALFDVVFCTQVLEHVEDPGFLIAEISRVLRPGGIVILNAPFIYPFHGMPLDFHRYTTASLKNLFHDFDEVDIGVLGGIGSSLATLWNNFIVYLATQSTFGQAVRLVMFPLWLIHNAFVNIASKFLDAVDKTESFPLNVYAVAKKKAMPQS